MNVLQCKDDFENDIEGGEDGNEDEGNVSDARNSGESSSTSSESHEDESLIVNKIRLKEHHFGWMTMTSSDSLSDKNGLSAMIILIEDNLLTFEEVTNNNK